MVNHNTFLPDGMMSEKRSCEYGGLSESDISEIESIPDDIELMDSSSASDEEYEPNNQTSEISYQGYQPGQEEHRLSRPSCHRPSTSSRPNAMNQPSFQVPVYVRTYAGEEDKYIEEEFTENTGIKDCPPRNSAPLQYFFLFFTDAFMNLIICETNKHANKALQQRMNSGQLKRFSRIKKWVDVTVNELKCYLAIIINIGLNGKIEFSKYWDSRFSQCMPFF